MSDAKPTSRTPVDAEERARLERAGALVVDSRRVRPRYFDGRFLAARDLTAEQSYVLRRQADLARAAGWGVVSGLEVSAGSNATHVRIAAGHAVAPSGEPVVLTQALDVNLFDLRRSEQLDAHLGLRTRGQAVTRGRSGAFVLAIRPVEYTANPRRGYPTSVTGTPTTEDHDIVEAAALTLVPWPQNLGGSADVARRQLVRDVFYTQSGRGLNADLVPLAMVWLDGVAIRWIDVHLVRREAHASHQELLGLGTASRAVRIAAVRQYLDHLRSVSATAQGAAFAAHDAFEVLPPVGQVPLSAVDLVRFSQTFFPAETDIDVSFAPRDEIAALVEESLTLPAIDLHAGADVLAATAILLLVPVERADLRAFRSTLTSVRRPLAQRTLPVPTARNPQMALARFRLSKMAVARAATPDPETAAWTALLQQVLPRLRDEGFLWYVRRRNANYRADIEGRGVDLDAQVRVLPRLRPGTGIFSPPIVPPREDS